MSKCCIKGGILKAVATPLASNMEEEKRRGSFFQKSPQEIATTPDASKAFYIPEAGTEERRLAERKLVRKLDTRLLPTIILVRSKLIPRITRLTKSRSTF